MSGKSSSSAMTSTNAPPPTKLPKFLQGKANRDRSRSVNDQQPPSAPLSAAGGSKTPSGSSLASGNGVAASSSSSSVAGESSKHGRQDRRSSKLKGVLKELKDDRIDSLGDESTVEDFSVIIEPAPPRSRTLTRADRPLSASASDSNAHPSGASFYPNTSHAHGGRFSDVGTRLSGWFTHAFSTSSTDLSSLPALLSTSSPASSQPLSSSPKPTKQNVAGMALLTAARHGKGYLNKGVRLIMDSDATPDKCPDPIWLLGVQHTGYEPPPPPPASMSPPSGRRSSLDFRRSSSSFRSSQSSSRGSTSSPEPSLSHSTSSRHGNANTEADPGLHWPPVFYQDFTSRIWLTYRSHYVAIRDQSLAALDSDSLSDSPQVSASPRRWNLNLLGGEKGWTSDTGWGCMLRTGQSLLANALIHLHLGRDWRRPPVPVHSADYVTYVKILTWFFDSPDPNCPFSVHRMALAGKDLGKDVGQWFGPSTAAGAIKTLVQAFPEAGLGVAVALDGVLYETDVLAASNVSPYHYHRHTRMGTTSSSPAARRIRGQRHGDQQRQSMLGSAWGQRPVLVLIGIRLGISGVNPIYYDTIKALYTFPQSVGIAGGRPSSSYYFVGSQADSLFYLDPHHTRPAIPFRPPPSSSTSSNSAQHKRHQQVPSSSSSASSFRPQSPAVTTAQRYPRVSPSPDSASTYSDGSNVSSQHEATQEHYINAYSPTDLKTFHCDRVRKMPLSGLDPSMLIGFLCRDEQDWRDLRARISDMQRKAFSIQDEPPSWPSDSDDMGLESMSDVDIDGPEDAFSPDLDDADENLVEVEGELREEDLRPSNDDDGEHRRSEDVLTEDDPVGPVTPGAGTLTHEQAIEQAQVNNASKFGKQQQEKLISIGTGDPEDDDRGYLDDDEEWIATSMPTPQARERERDRSDISGSWVDSTSKPSSRVNLAATASTNAMKQSQSQPLSQSNGSSSRTPSATREKEREHKRGSNREPSSSSTSRIPTSKSKMSSSRSSSSTAKPKSSSANRSKRSSVQSTKEYYPFPVVDDREEADFEADSDADEYDMTTSSSGDFQRPQRRKNSSALRTPIASVTGNDTRGQTVTEPVANGGGSKIRNVRGKDGGRTQSGGVKGIVTSEFDE